MTEFTGQTMADEKGDEPARLIATIEAYCEAAGIKTSTFGQKVLADRDAIKRLRNYSDRIVSYRERITAYIADNPPEPEQADARRGAA